MTEQVPAVDAWVRLVRGSAAAQRALNARLVNDHGLTINDYECLLLLARAEGRRLRRVDLADRLILTASGVTRMLDGLEVAGFVDRATCDTDRRVTYAVLTEVGRTKLREASKSHILDIRGFFEEHLNEEELDQLVQLLGRLPGVAAALGEACSAG